MAETVTVYCNIPMGLRLRLHTWQDQDQLVMGGGVRTVKQASVTGQEIVLNGTSSEHGNARRDAAGNFVLMVGGFAATPNVDKEFWDKWREQNADLDAIKKGCVFARGKPADAAAQAKDHAEVKSGMEPMVPTLMDGAGKVIQSDPRAPRGVSRHEGVRVA